MDALKEAFQAALEVQAKAHAPYSQFRVGAALKIKNQPVLICGCNVENASYGATICAERSAFLQAVSQFGTFEAEYLVLVTDSKTADSPCGLCLQVMTEFVSPDFLIHLATQAGIQSSVRLKDLLPRPFDKSNLPR